MSEQKHTSEPWRVSVVSGTNEVVAGRGFHIAFCKANASKFKDEQAANARRIVACVNACKDIPTDDLERFGLTALNVTANKIAEQRDQLLALVKRYRNETPIGHQPHMICHLVDEAIAEAERQP